MTTNPLEAPAPIRSITFIDGNLSQSDVLTAGLSGQHVVHLHAEGNGIEQITHEEPSIASVELLRTLSSAETVM